MEAMMSSISISREQKSSTSIQIDQLSLQDDDILNNIVRNYPEGIDSIISTPEPPKQSAYMMIVLRGTESFVNKYINKAKRKNTSDEGDITLVKIEENETEKRNKMNNFTFFEQLKIKRAETKKYQQIMSKVFNELNKTKEKLVERIVELYCKDKSEKIKQKDEEYYKKCLNTIREMFDTELNYYYELSFEDFVLLFCSIIHYYTKIEIKLELRSRNSKKVMLSFYTTKEESYEAFADFFGYELQLKPYAQSYDEMHELSKSTNINSRKNSSIKISSFTNKKTLQFFQLDEDNCLHFPPYFPFEIEKKIKYRRYLQNDDYHECEYDEELNRFFVLPNNINTCQCSKFRNIDRLRLIYRSLMHLLQFSSLYKHNMISMIIYKQNYLAYGDKLNVNTLFCDIAKVYSSKSYIRTITTIRNFYGEHISYYFLWVSSFSYWMILPTIIGIALKASIYNINNEIMERTIPILEVFKFELYDLCLILFSIIINIWATLFLKNWKNIESMFRYYWGMEKYAAIQSQSEFYVPDQVKPFILGEMVSMNSRIQKIKKNIGSFVICVVLILFRGLIVFYACSLGIRMQTPISFNHLVILSSASGLITKIFGVINEFFAYRLSIWENNETTVQQQNSFAIKLIFLEAANCYFYLLYIAFYKPCMKEYPCYGGKCNKELEYAVYVLLFCNFIFTVWELIWPFIKRFIRKSIGQYNKKDIRFGRFEPHSIEHQLLCDGKNNLIKEYNQKMIRFGFVCLFSNAAPLAPLFVFLINILEYFADTYKIFNLYRIEIVEGSSGIGIYNAIFKTLYFFGMLININLVLFTSQKFFKFKITKDEFEKLKDNDGFIMNTLLMVIIENFMLLIIQAVRPKNVPLWFQHLSELKNLYDKKYFSREAANLPHNNIGEMDTIQ